MSSEYYIPRRLQERKFLFWHYNEVLVFFLSFGIGLLIGREIMGVFAGIFFIKILKACNKNGRECYLISLLFWHFPKEVSGFKKTPPSYLKTFR